MRPGPQELAVGVCVQCTVESTGTGIPVGDFQLIHRDRGLQVDAGDFRRKDALLFRLEEALMFFREVYR